MSPEKQAIHRATRGDRTAQTDHGVSNRREGGRGGSCCVGLQSRPAAVLMRVPLCLTSSNHEVQHQVPQKLVRELLPPLGRVVEKQRKQIARLRISLQVLSTRPHDRVDELVDRSKLGWEFSFAS